MDLLPSSHDRGDLLARLGSLIEERGFETFVRAPLLEPSPRYFPDSWEPSERGVRTLSLRLLRYAGLELDAVVTLHDPDDIPDEVSEAVHGDAAAWFSGIDDDSCLFGANTAQLESEDGIVGTMCHEIAHAYRSYFELEGDVVQIEEENTDLTTIFLGFGVLTTNNTYRYRKAGTYGLTEWSTSQVGYLPPQAMAFLLGAQLVARGASASERRRIEKLLETNQAACFRAACEELEKDVDDLRRRLSIPPVEAWPAVSDFVLPELPLDATFTPSKNAARKTRDLRNDGRNVFRIPDTMVRHYTFLSIGIGLALAIGVGFAIHALFTETVRLRIFFATWALTLVAGFVFGIMRHDDFCSDCGAKVTKHDSTCRGCGGTVRGVLSRASDRMHANEILEAGGTFEDFQEERSKGNRRLRRKWIIVGACVGIPLALAMFGENIPFPSTARAMKEARSVTFNSILMGDAVFEPGEKHLLDSDDKTEVLASFLLDDGTATIPVWYSVDDVEGRVQFGDHVRVMASWQFVNVDGDHRSILVARWISVDKSSSTPSVSSSASPTSPTSEPASSSDGTSAQMEDEDEPDPSDDCFGDDALEPSFLESLETASSATAKKLAELARAPHAALCVRLADALATWRTSTKSKLFSTWLEEHPLVATDEEMKGALFKLTKRAIRTPRPIVAAQFHQAWLARMPTGAALEPIARKATKHLYALLNEVEPAESRVMARKTLQHDPEFFELADAMFHGARALEIIAVLTELKNSPHPPTWLPRVARDLPLHATIKELESEEKTNAIVKAMTSFGSVPQDLARTQLKAAKPTAAFDRDP